MCENRRCRRNAREFARGIRGPMRSMLLHIWPMLPEVEMVRMCTGSSLFDANRVNLGIIVALHDATDLGHGANPDYPFQSQVGRVGLGFPAIGRQPAYS